MPTGTPYGMLPRPWKTMGPACKAAHHGHSEGASTGTVCWANGTIAGRQFISKGMIADFAIRQGTGNPRPYPACCGRWTIRQVASQSRKVYIDLDDRNGNESGSRPQMESHKDFVDWNDQKNEALAAGLAGHRQPLSEVADD